MLLQKERLHMLHSVAVGMFLLSWAREGSGSIDLTGRRRLFVRICDKLRPFLQATKGGSRSDTLLNILFSSYCQ